MQALTCPNCGAPVEPPESLEDRTLTCGFCRRTFERDAKPPASPAGNALPRSVNVAARRLALAAVGGGLLLVAMGVLLLMMARPRASDAPAMPTAPTPLPPQAQVPDIPQAPPPPPVVDAASAPPLDVETDPVTLQWKGHLTSSTGSAPPVGAPCTVTATVSSHGSRDAHEDLLTLQCQGQMLYDSSVPLNGMSSSSFGLDEVPVAGQVRAFEYAMRAEDLGSRSAPRAQISLSTPDGLLEAFRDTMPSYRVRAQIDRVSAVRKGRAITADSVPPFDEVVVRKAKVVSQSGAVPFGGSTCDLRVSPAYRSGHSCRVLLTCGGRAIYGGGGGGFDDCLLEGGSPRTFVDAKPTPVDGDPELNCDLAAGTAVLGDTSKSGTTYSVTFGLAAP